MNIPAIAGLCWAFSKAGTCLAYLRPTQAYHSTSGRRNGGSLQGALPGLRWGRDRHETHCHGCLPHLVRHRNLRSTPVSCTRQPRQAAHPDIRYLAPPEAVYQVIEEHTRRNGTTSKPVQLPDGSPASWFGNPDAQRLLIYYPGGGYVYPMVPTHLCYIDNIITDLKRAAIDVGVLLLHYDLAPTARPPRQLEQAIGALRYAIETLGKRPSDIVILGDSAGGHLALSVLSHLAHPHPSIPALSLTGNLAGALLLSPWMIDSRADYESHRQNADRDSLSLRTLNSWADMYLGDTTPDNYSQPAGAPKNWWRSLPVKKIFIGVGGDEVMLDSTVETARKIEVSHTDAVIGDVTYSF